MDEPGDDAEQAARVARRRPIPRFGRGGRIALAVALVALAALIALWIGRKPIAGHVIDRELARRGVAARYTIGDLGFGAQRLTDVIIGDPADPDLVADWIETDTGFGLNGPRLVKLRAGHVRVRGRWQDGRITLGELDKLMGPPSGKPFALPAMRVDIADARMRLETPAGPVGLRLSGEGRIDDGFDGRFAAVAPGLAVAGCDVRGLAAALHVTTTDGAPRFAGPVRAAQGSCGNVALADAGLDVDAALSARLDHWQGSARLASGAVRGPGVAATAAQGRLDLAGNAAATAGHVALAAVQVRTAPGAAARLTVDGDYRIGATQSFAGRLAVEGARADRRLPDMTAATASTPLAPLARRMDFALRQAARSFAARATIRAERSPDDTRITLTDAELTAASGARLRLTSGDGIGYARRAPLSGAAQLALAGGGLPTVTADVARRRPDATLQAQIAVAPYAVEDARLALTPIRLALQDGGALRLTTRAQLSGPLAGSGRVDGLTVPVDLRRDGWGAIVINPGCTPLALRRLVLSGLTLDPVATRVCAPGEGLVRSVGGRIDGGARLGTTHLTGRLGGTPLDLAATGATLGLGDRGFTVAGLAVRLGSAERVTRIDIADLAGRVTDGGVAGTFAGGAGQIGAVPLLLGEAAGDWRFRGGVLALTGALTVRDAADVPRFNPMNGRDVALTVADGAIRATGTLAEPTTGTRVADVVIAHRLSTGEGRADLTVPGITFAKTFQPDLLTTLTKGVVADVDGVVTGEGHIAWSAAGVTSTGQFATTGLNLAAALGPVTGITTTIHFTDLLALESAPGQVATIKTVNPGIAVNDGTIRYQTLAGSRVRVESGTWPFAGGQLTLLPTTLDFSTDQPRRMTFRIRGAAADQFLQQFDFKNLDATGIFDGELPMVFDTTGGRIEGGHLTVREGGGGLAYVGELTQKDLGFWGNLAFQALRSLRYRSLTITMNGPLAGEMVTQVRFAGVTQGKGAKSNFLIRRLQRLPFVFNVQIKAPFRGLLDSAQSFYDPSRLIQRNLPALLEEQRKQGIQPPASETVP
ncbi:hypothetical protein D9601_00780 [Sphingomonas sp. MA1305]|uniref:intermembrane phospholipid transport protein YdbH family protein n=1 Tax=Sphingomonas sp. MA1305 TaxID=2479204 RepID=UPI0018E04CA7|nr:YdbH domain-containing protein [Sphingomonas sp. MA1305]MBI0473897.1 hypothetical protein [Sphingomonas sp. MA1305]